ncbi:MAG: ergothioneine biosynthesis protein EgtB [Hyphomicrobiaceae bacterium]
MATLQTQTPTLPTMAERLFATRRQTVQLSEPLTDEDMTVQASDDASPTKWHLGHTTWFFETFVLIPHLPGYEVHDPNFGYCFNSYYESVGKRQPRQRRGLMTRPTVKAVLEYRSSVDRALEMLLAGPPGKNKDILSIIELGINHEQQHQELLLTDILAVLASQPLRPAYTAAPPALAEVTGGSPDDGGRWLDFEGGIARMGHDDTSFAWDNESPSHEVLLHPFRLAERLVTNADWLQFIDDGGYRQPLLWLADGWAAVNREGWTAPEYWEHQDGAWHAMGLEGFKPVVPNRPVSHISYYEADAFARWRGHRLPTEFEWEFAARSHNVASSVAAVGLHPPACKLEKHAQLQQMFDHVWQWTSSSYSPYPRYRPPEGAIGEYNGKFMVSQQVLRGSSCFTPPGHSRVTYRNFFYPNQRWQMTGLRLADDLD